MHFNTRHAQFLSEFFSCAFFSTIMCCLLRSLVSHFYLRKDIGHLGGTVGSWNVNSLL